MNIEIADESTELNLPWDEARLYCFTMGPGWRLPTKEELDWIFHSENDFKRCWYWSSTETISTTHAWNQCFGPNIDRRNGVQEANVKISSLCVRAVRDR